MAHDPLAPLREAVLEALMALALLLDERIPRRGRPLPEAVEAKGDEAARQWLATGGFPLDQAAAEALFPRLWFANAFLQHGKLYGTGALASLPERSLLAALLTDGWRTGGRRQWEAPAAEAPWGG